LALAARKLLCDCGQPNQKDGGKMREVHKSINSKFSYTATASLNTAVERFNRNQNLMDNPQMLGIKKRFCGQR
jgi:hypothetical protein